MKNKFKKSMGASFCLILLQLFDEQIDFDFIVGMSDLFKETKEEVSFMSNTTFKY